MNIRLDQYMDIFKDAVEDSAVATLISHEILRLPHSTRHTNMSRS